MKVKAVFFDLDGTLTDSIEDLAESMNYALRKFSLPERTVSECRDMVGYGRQHFGDMAVGDRDELVDDVLGVMKAHYLENYCEKTVLYEGIREVVDELAEKGIRMAVITNKDQDVACRIVEDFFGEGFFEEVVGAANGNQPKPEPDTVLGMCSRMGVEPGECVLVGDSEVDVATARNAGLLGVAVSWGFRDMDILQRSKPDKLINRPGELLGVILDKS